ncbi:MAG TPA: cytochrome P450 [Mycobacteriales bacterium]|nr:cytochrome P450 [Mycobacteriales bacterium]
MSIATELPPFPIDLYSASSFSSGHPAAQYAWLREHDPVHRHVAPDGGHFWAVTRHRDIEHVERNADLFAASPSVLLIENGPGNGFYSMDYPQHPQYRRLVAPRLVPPAVKVRLPQLEALATEIIDSVAQRGECELVEDVAAAMAGYTAADFLGMPRADGRRMHDLLMVLHSSVDQVGEEAMGNAMMEALAMGQKVFAERRANPTDDVYSMYANMLVDGEPITEWDFLGNYLLLTDGSLDTTRNVIAGGMKLLFDNPDQRALLMSDLDRYLPGAVEEMTRLVSPVVYITRRATADTEIAGQPIAAGDRVAIYFGSGNRDPELFDDPERFDIERDAKAQIAFGSAGPHFCVGAHLGRAEARVLLRELLTRLPDIAPAGPETWATTSLTSGLAELPVRFTPER